METLGRQLTPLGQSDRAVLLEDVAAVEVTVLVEVVGRRCHAILKAEPTRSLSLAYGDRDLQVLRARDQARH